MLLLRMSQLQVSTHAPSHSISITDIGIFVVVISHHRARTDNNMPVYYGGIRAYVGFLVDTIKARGGTTN